MRSTFAPLALAALVAANPVPQGVTSAIAPKSSPPAGCSENYSGSFEISIIKASSKSKRQETGSHTPLILTLKNGVLTDEKGRTGYIAANNQFQFDSPPQTGAIYTAGFSICSNGSLAIGADTTWYQCLSGTFYNLYDEASAAQCSPVEILAVSTSSNPTPTGVASQISDGQITGSAVPSPQCTQYVDGQPQCNSATTPTPTPACTEYVDGQPQCGKATTMAPTTTAPPKPVCTEYVDGQPQCGSAITTPPPCTEYKDGQPQCGGATTPPYPTGTGNAPPAYPTGTGAMTTSWAPIATGAAVVNGPAAGLLAVAGFAVAMM